MIHKHAYVGLVGKVRQNMLYSVIKLILIQGNRARPYLVLAYSVVIVNIGFCL